MTILVTCQCGKQFRAEDEHAGMEGKCPACEQLMVIPGSQRAEPLAPPVAASTSDGAKVDRWVSRSMGLLVTAMIIFVLTVVAGVTYYVITRRGDEGLQGSANDAPNEEAPARTKSRQEADQRASADAVMEEPEGAPTPIPPVAGQPQPEPPPPRAAHTSAEPLPNGIVFDDNLSVAIAKIEREPNITSVCLGFRRIGPKWPQLPRGFQLRIVDDRNNEYQTYFSLGSGMRGPQALAGKPVDIENLPNGFTWTGLAKVPMPQAAPIVRIALEREGLNTGFVRIDNDVLPKRSVGVDFAHPAFPNLEFKIGREQLLSQGDEIRFDEHLSYRLGAPKAGTDVATWDASERKFSFTLPFVVKNVDYNEHEMPPFALYVQLDDGTVIWCGSGTGSCPGLSTKNWDIVGSIRFQKGLRGTIANPRTLLLYTCERRYRHDFFRFVSISDDLKRQWSEAKRRYLLPERAMQPEPPSRERALAPAGQRGRTGPLSGTWQTASGAEYRIADDGKEITISLIDSSQIADFSAKLTRRDAKADAKFLDGKVEVVFAIDPKRTPRRIDVLGILDEKDPNVLGLRFGKWPFFDVNGNPRGSRLLNEELKRE